MPNPCRYIQFRVERFLFATFFIRTDQRPSNITVGIHSEQCRKFGRRVVRTDFVTFVFHRAERSKNQDR